MFFCFSLFSFSCEIISPHALLFYTSPWPGRMHWEGSITKWKVLALSYTMEKALGSIGLCMNLAFNLCCALLGDLRVCYCSVAHLILTLFNSHCYWCYIIRAFIIQCLAHPLLQPIHSHSSWLLFRLHYPFPYKEALKITIKILNYHTN